ncbi:MAG: glycine oxidase ThiO [Gammaproteobacteria bacterium]|nr:glycine oxidase ThiO [Gammaproteobacteria bacterium]
MAAASDCIVVGGGLIGLLTARELAVRGLKVTVLERNAETGRESSWAGGGILSPLYPWRYPGPVQTLVAWSQAHYPALIEQLRSDSGIDPQWQCCGLLQLDDGDDMAQGWLRRHGIRYQRVEPREMQYLEPRLSVTSNRPALLLPEVAQVRNPELLKAACKAALHHGVRIETGSVVQRLLAQAGRVTGVVTAQHTWMTSRVIIASGAWTGGLLAGLDGVQQVIPVRGQMLLFRARPGLIRHIVLDQGHYLIPRRDGRVLVGSTVEYVGFDKQTTTEAFDSLRAMALATVPALADAVIEQHWAGLRPGSVDGVPIIGTHPGLAGLYINSGHFRNGVVMAPASARLLADLITGNQTIVDPRAYQPRSLEAPV